MADTPITPGVGSLGLAPKFQGVGLGVLTGTGSLATATASQDQWSPPVGAMVFAGFAPSGVSPRLPLVAALLFTGLAPVLTQNPQQIPVVGSLSLTGYATWVVRNGPVALQRITSTGISRESPFTAGAATLQFITAAGISIQPNSASGAGTLQQITGVGYGPVYGIAVLAAITGTGMQGNYTTGAGILLPVGVPGSWSSGYAVLERVTATGTSHEALIQVFLTKTMNTRMTSVTEYQNFNFNSYAFFNGNYYGAGPGGLYLLDGNDDDGVNIDWSFKTGQMDDKTVELKRLPEIVMGLRANGPVRVRVWKDDNTYFDYTLPATNTNTIHQQRVQPGKGMRSRYYMVELLGLSNAAIEIDSMQVNMSKTTRRIG